jgi:copper(I)-binding protein
MTRRLFLFVAAFASACSSRAIDADIGITNAVYIVPASDGPAAVYFTIHNPTATPDTLLAVSSPSLNKISLHETMRMGDGASAMMHMTAVARVTVPAQGDLTFAPGRYHAMASGAASPIANRTTLALTMTFATHAPIATTARVLTYADYDSRASAPKH